MLHTGDKDIFKGWLNEGHLAGLLASLEKMGLDIRLVGWQVVAYHVNQ